MGIETFGGRLHPHRSVTEAKSQRVHQLYQEAKRGSRVSLGTLQEALSTSDALYALAYNANVRNLPEYDRKERQWRKIAQPYGVENFKKVTYGGLQVNFEDLQYGSGTPGIAPVIPEGAEYPHALKWTEQELDARLKTRGFKAKVTRQEIINDTLGVISRLPQEMLEVGYDTEEFVVFNSLVQGAGGSSQLAGGTIPEAGVVVAANAKLSQYSLIQGLIEIGKRRIGGRAVPIAPAYHLVVATGQGISAEYALRKDITNIRVDIGGGVALDSNPVFPELLGRVKSVIESDAVATDAWYLVPEAGSTRLPSLLKLELIGFETPEIFVKSNAHAVPGASFDQFGLLEFQFEDDATHLKLRHDIEGALLTQDQIVWSSGAGLLPSA